LTAASLPARGELIDGAAEHFLGYNASGRVSGQVSGTMGPLQHVFVSEPSRNQTKFPTEPLPALRRFRREEVGSLISSFGKEKKT
jgi:hypothetical protein